VAKVDSGPRQLDKRLGQPEALSSADAITKAPAEKQRKGITPRWRAGRARTPPQPLPKATPTPRM